MRCPLLWSARGLRGTVGRDGRVVAAAALRRHARDGVRRGLVAQRGDGGLEERDAHVRPDARLLPLQQRQEDRLAARRELQGAQRVLNGVSCCLRRFG